MSPVLSDKNVSVSVSCIYLISSASSVSERQCCFTSIHLSYFPPRRISSYFSARACGHLCALVCALSKADSCQILGRLISFVFHTVSSIYPSPVERGGKISEVLLLWRAEPDTHGPIPTEAAFIIRPTHSIVQAITFSVALSSSEETGSPKRASGQRIQCGLAQTNQNSYKIFALVTCVTAKQLLSKRTKKRKKMGLRCYCSCAVCSFCSRLKVSLLCEGDSSCGVFAG